MLLCCAFVPPDTLISESAERNPDTSIGLPVSEVGSWAEHKNFTYIAHPSPKFYGGEKRAKVNGFDFCPNLQLEAG